MGRRMLVGGGVAAVAVLALVITLWGNQPSTQAAAAWPVAKVALAKVRQGEALARPLPPGNWRRPTR